MPGLVAQAQVTTFTTPVDGDPAAASVVLGNDNTLKTSHNTHDADATIHVQSSVVASRPAFGTAGRFWVTTDASVPRVWYDTGAAWLEIDYLNRTQGGTVAGMTVSSTLLIGDTVNVRFGGATASFPALRNSGATLLLRLADDSAYAALTMGTLTVVSGGAAITGNSAVTGTLTTSAALTVSAGGASVTGAVTIAGSAADPATTTRFIGANGSASNMRLNVPAAATITSSVAGSAVAVASSTGLAVTGEVTGSTQVRGPTGSAATVSLAVGLGSSGFYDRTALGVVTVNPNGQNAGEFDADATAGNTRFLLWDVSAAALVRVTRGAVDSGGAGFRVLRIPN